MESPTKAVPFTRPLWCEPVDRPNCNALHQLLRLAGSAWLWVHFWPRCGLYSIPDLESGSCLEISWSETNEITCGRLIVKDVVYATALCDWGSLHPGRSHDAHPPSIDISHLGFPPGPFFRLLPESIARKRISR